MNLPQAIRDRRKALGLTQQQLADACNSTQEAVSNMERGTRRKQPSLKERAMVVLGLTVTPAPVPPEPPR
jgi:transcriptional regulator with XRE-family HTH domain